MTGALIFLRIAGDWISRSGSSASPQAFGNRKFDSATPTNWIPLAFSMSLAWLLGFVEASHAQGSPVTAIDILLEPDATMVQHAQPDNARLLKAYPAGFALDATHHPHVTMLQQFVHTADLGKVHTAANRILADKKVTSWNLKAFKYYYIPVPPYGIAGIVIEPKENLLQLRQALLDAVAPFTERTGTLSHS
jgi:hypothetical protein